MRTKTNYSGGIQGGITNGEPIIMRAAFKPTATIIQDQDSVNEENEEVTFKAKGRHDPCVVPRAVPICEAMAALVLIDHALRQRAQGGVRRLKAEFGVLVENTPKSCSHLVDLHHDLMAGVVKNEMIYVGHVFELRPCVL